MRTWQGVEHGSWGNHKWTACHHAPPFAILPRMNRRHFLQLSASATGFFALRPLLAADAVDAPPGRGASFFLASDTHYLADKENPSAMDETSRDINARLVEWLNKLPGTETPAEAGGGTVGEVQGVIHSGDLIDTGDKNGGVHEAMQKTEWSAFAAGCQPRLVTCQRGTSIRNGLESWQHPLSPLHHFHGIWRCDCTC